MKQVLASAILILTFLTVGPGIAIAGEDDPPIPSDTQHISLTGDQGEELGSADFVVRSGFPGRVDLHGWVADSKSDSRCVYLKYDVITAFGVNADGKLARVCGNRDAGYGSHSEIEAFGARFDKVNFSLCREQGFGRDACTDIHTVNSW